MCIKCNWSPALFLTRPFGSSALNVIIYCKPYFSNRKRVVRHFTEIVLTLMISIDSLSDSVQSCTFETNRKLPSRRLDVTIQWKLIRFLYAFSTEFVTCRCTYIRSTYIIIVRVELSQTVGKHYGEFADRALKSFGLNITCISSACFSSGIYDLSSRVVHVGHNVTWTS